MKLNIEEVKENRSAFSIQGLKVRLDFSVGRSLETFNYQQVNHAVEIYQINVKLSSVVPLQ